MFLILESFFLLPAGPFLHSPKAPGGEHEDVAETSRRQEAASGNFRLGSEHISCSLQSFVDLQSCAHNWSRAAEPTALQEGVRSPWAIAAAGGRAALAVFACLLGLWVNPSPCRDRFPTRDRQQVGLQSVRFSHSRIPNDTWGNEHTCATRKSCLQTPTTLQPWVPCAAKSRQSQGCVGLATTSSAMS